MKTKEELAAIKAEIETVSKKLAELTEDELTQVAGGDVTSANIVGCIKAMMPYIAGCKEHDEQIVQGTAYDMPKKNEDEKYVMF